MEKVHFLIFDCYGTLIDWDKGIRELFVEIFPGKDQKFIERAIKIWEEIQFKRIQEKYIPYSELQNRSFLELFRKLKVIANTNIGNKMLSQIPEWEPFPDVYSVLLKLKKHFKLVLLSNGPLSILKKNARRMNIKFDAIISAELVGAYKPSLSVFKYALRQLNEPIAMVLHIAAGYKYDVIPAKSLGIQTIWVNRKGIVSPGAISPDYEVPDLTSLAQILSLN